MQQHEQHLPCAISLSSRRG